MPDDLELVFAFTTDWRSEEGTLKSSRVQTLTNFGTR